jgi:hypothetical protein
MAKYEKNLRGNFKEVLKMCENTIMKNSSSASYEGGSSWQHGDVSMAVRVYERYSMFGKNRVSLNLTLVGNKEELFLSAITSGGSQAVLFKINTIGEEAFLNTLIPVIEAYAQR